MPTMDRIEFLGYQACECELQAIMPQTTHDESTRLLDRAKRYRMEQLEAMEETSETVLHGIDRSAMQANSASLRTRLKNTLVLLAVVSTVYVSLLALSVLAVSLVAKVVR